MKVVVNRCFGGFGLSDTAYEWLIAHGIPVRKYEREERGEDGRYIKNKNNEGQVIFDRELTPEGEDQWNDHYWKYKGSGSRLNQRYWDSWIDDDRSNPLLIKCVEELGKKADGWASELEVVDIPDGVEWEIDDYDGQETVEEKRRSW